MGILKKFSLLLCCFMMMFTFTACGGGEKSLILSSDKDFAYRGDVVTFSVNLKDEKDKTYTVEEVVYEIVSGGEYATISGNTLTIKDDALPGAVVEVIAKAEEKVSNKVKVEVNVPLTDIVISANGLTNIEAGDFVPLTMELNPEISNVSKDDIKWVIVEGADLCIISNDILFVNKNASTNEVIKIKAQSNTLSSNVLTFTVGYALEKIELDVVGSLSIEPGNSRALKTTLTPSNATDVNIEWVFSEGQNYCSISNNIITINDDVEIGTIIKVKAKSGSVESEEITIIVGTPVTKIIISAVGADKVITTNTVSLNASVEPQNASTVGIEWSVTEGKQYAQVVNNTLVIKSETPYGTIIKVKAKSGLVVSENELSVQYGVAVTSVTIDTVGSLEVITNNTIGLNAVVNPVDATEKTINWKVTQGSEYAEISNNALVVKAGTPYGTIIKVKATCDGIESNELSVQYGIKLKSLELNVSGSSNIEPGNTRALLTTLTPENATNVVVEWVTLEGEGLFSISNNIISINSDAEIGSKIRLKAKSGTVESNEITIIVGTPITKITISAVGVDKIITTNTVSLNVSVEPQNASAIGVNWKVTQGSEYAEVVNNTLVIKAGTPYGTIIKVKAESGTLESENELEFQYGVKVASVVINTAGSLEVIHVNTVGLNATISPSNATEKTVTWSVTENSEYAEISNNALVVKEGTPYGTIIKIKATVDGVESNELSVQYGVAVTSVTISATSEVIVSGNTVGLNAVVNPSNATEKTVSWMVIQGANNADIVNNTLVVKAGTPYGTIIKVKAICDGVESNELSVQYGIAVSSVVISPAGSLEVIKGNSVGLSAVINPSDATEKTVSWTITEGSSYADIVSNTLVVKANAETGAIIVVKATVDGVESNELEFVVKATKEEENASKFMINVSEENIKLDKNANFSPVLEVELYDYNFEPVTDKVITYKIVEGEEFLAISPNGYNCNFEILGHGNATLEVGIQGYSEKTIVNVSVVLPPEKINIPEVFTERTGYVYNFSKLNPSNSAVETLPFIATATGTNVCQDIKYTFMHEDGTSGDLVATWNDGRITFNKTGKITVIISSDSGSRIETTTSYSFNINEGFNVYTFEELQALALSSKYNGQPINIVVLERPDGSANNYEYGFDLVSPAGLKAKLEQTFDDVFTAKGGFANGQRINFVCKSVHINGNKHKIDLSQVRKIKKEEIEPLVANGRLTADWKNFDALISIIPWTNDTNVILKGSYEAKIYDFEVVGNCSVDHGSTEDGGEFSGTKPFGVVSTGITIGAMGHEVKYYVDINNLTTSGLRTGLSVKKVVGNGLVQNIHAYNCFTNGIEVGASIVRLKNLKFGSCGAASIELLPADSNAAGENFDQKQNVSFEGYMDVEQNLNNGNTTYFANYQVLGTTIPSVVEGLLTQYDVTQGSHMRNEKGEYIFVCFNLADMTTFYPNHSTYNYPAFQEGGIINARDLPKDGNAVDTTHQYIELDVDLTFMGGSNIGKAILYNHHYQGN
ncbi:MAG: Ig-like domain-containing protein [Clostridia bacterium]|nr:Ig-like domain-containing protein [Clostridia bacterium]